MDIRPGGLDDRQVRALLETHLVGSRAESPKCSEHALEVDELNAADIFFWSAWEESTLLGFGALKRLTPNHFEVKSMHTAREARGTGGGGTILRHLIAQASQRGVKRLSLETGSSDYFRPAIALYKKHGFVECPPFSDYRLDPNSVFMTLALDLHHKRHYESASDPRRG